MIKENNGIPKCLGYNRVSTISQAEYGLSLDVQKTKILEKIHELGGELAEDIYMDSGISGTTMNRPALQEMLARCSKGDISYLIVQDSSRISRNTFEYLFIKKQLEKYGVKTIPLTGMVVDENNPFSEAVDELIAVVNSIQPKLTSYKVKQTAREKIKNGIYPSFAPLGFKNIVNPNPTGSYDKRIVVQDEKTAPFITQAFIMYATGDHSIFSITQYLVKNGVEGRLGKKLHYSTVYNILTNPFCFGLMHWKELEVMGKHTPLIDKPTFDIVQGILAGKGDYGIRKRKHNFLLNGFVFCKNCGRRFVAEWHYGDIKFKARGGRIGYYHCSGLGKRGTGCKEKYILLEDLEGQVEQEIEKLEFKPEFVEAVKRNVKQVYNDTAERVQTTKKAINNRKVAIEQKRNKLEEELLAGTFDREAYKRLNIKIDAELLDIQTELLEIDKVRTVDMGIIEEVLAITQNIAKAYKEADIFHKKAYLHFFFKEFLIKDKKIAEIKYQPVIEVLQQANTVILSTTWLPSQDYNFLKISIVFLTSWAIPLIQG